MSTPARPLDPDPRHVSEYGGNWPADNDGRWFPPGPWVITRPRSFLQGFLAGVVIGLAPCGAVVFR